MTDTKTDTKAAAPQAAPPAQVPATRKEGWENFKAELDKRADEIGSQLPSNVSRDRFINASIAAVKATPAILTATPRSLFAALTKAAQDGLLPDGREGIITVFNTTVDGHKEAIAQWNPMFYGIRKRARELDGIIIDAQVVFVGDEFDYSLGDEPHITHKPKIRTEAVDASAGVAVYAIFRHPEQGILHREVMWKPEVFAVMNQSRAKTSLMWTTFWTEGWRKTVGRRGAKSVPVSPQLERLIRRDDDNFEFDRTPTAPMIDMVPPTPDEPPPKGTTSSATSNEDEKSNAEPGSVPESQKSGEVEPGAKADLAATFTPEGEITSEVSAELAELEADLNGCTTEAGIEESFDAFDPQSRFAGNTRAIGAAFELREARINAIAMEDRAALEAQGQGDLLGGGR